MIITISGVGVSVQDGSFEIEDNVEERSVCEFVIVDHEGNKEFEKGQPVSVFDPDGDVELPITWDFYKNKKWNELSGVWQDFTGRNAIFAGYIEEAEKKRIKRNGLAFHYIRCIDKIYKADKRIVARSYTDMQAGDIVRELINEYLKEEGVKVGYEWNDFSNAKWSDL